MPAPRFDPSKFSAQPVSEPSFLDRLGGLRGVAATGVRGLTGVMSAEGGLLGAGLSGTGELGAELLEGSDPSLKRIGMEAALGAVPFGALLKEGRPLASAARGAVYGSVGQAGRELAQDKPLDPTAIATSGLLSGGMTGLLSRFLGGKPPTPSPTPSVPEVVITDSRGLPVKTLPGSSNPLPKGPADIPLEPPSLKGVPYGATPVQPSKAAAKADLNALASTKVDRLKSGLEQQPPSVSESVSATTPLGRKSAMTRWTQPKSDAPSGPTDESLIAALAKATGQPAEKFRVAPKTDFNPVPAYRVEAPAPNISQPLQPELPLGNPSSAAAASTGDESALLKFFRTKQGATGYNYRLAQDAVKAGEIPTAEFARDARLRESTPLSESVAPSTPSASPDWVTEQSNLVDSLKSMGNKAFGNEKGEINQKLLMSLGLGSIGAATGAVTDPLHDRFTSAAAGGALGAVAPHVPSLLMQLGAHPSTVENLDQKLSTDGIRATASKIAQTLPQIQRFNYLTDIGHLGFPINAFVGPYGSAVTSAIEHGLAGDERGWNLLKSLHPMDFAREVKASWPEAGERLRNASEGIGRGEVHGVGAAPTKLDLALAAPGTTMTAGDIAARRFIERAGFTPDEARRFTLTSEPELPAFSAAANFGKTHGKTSPFLQLLFPFKRTPANIGEQGMLRMPGIGTFLQAKRAVPDSPTQQFYQQYVMTPAISAGSAAIGSQIDNEDVSKTTGKFISNFAGPYSLPASIGYAAGRAIHDNQSPFGLKTLQRAGEALPLPTIQPITDWYKYAAGGFQGRPPSGSMPPDVRSYFFPPATSGTLASLPKFKR